MENGEKCKEEADDGADKKHAYRHRDASETRAPHARIIGVFARKTGTSLLPAIATYRTVIPKGRPTYSRCNIRKYRVEKCIHYILPHTACICFRKI